MFAEEDATPRAGGQEISSGADYLAAAPRHSGQVLTSRSAVVCSRRDATAVAHYQRQLDAPEVIQMPDFRFEAKVFRWALCGVLLAGSLTHAEHLAGHAHGRRQPAAIVAGQSTDDAPERHPASGRPMRVWSTAVASATNTLSSFVPSAGEWRFPYDPFKLTSLEAATLSCQVSADPGRAYLLQGPPCRTCGKPVQSWDDGRTAYCPDCLMCFPEKPNGRWYITRHWNT